MSGQQFGFYRTKSLQYNVYSMHNIIAKVGQFPLCDVMPIFRVGYYQLALTYSLSKRLASHLNDSGGGEQHHTHAAILLGTTQADAVLKYLINRY